MTNADVNVEVGTLDELDKERLRQLGRLLDNAVRVPGTRFGLGLDGMIGLIPGVGDAIGAMLAGYIMIQAARLGVSRTTLARMLLNVTIDTAFGVIPMVGDFFDFGWKANARNLALLNAHLERPKAVHRSSQLVLFSIIAAIVLALAGLVTLAVLLVNAVSQRLQLPLW